MEGIAEERQFLHDISTPLAAAMLLIDSLLEDIQDKQTDEHERLSDAYQALDRVNQLVDMRRTLIKARGAAGA